ncbi:MAG: hypothetical protein Q8S00_23130 [Deltaproteobacteria bacterium]|nr:hypothetical protein [Deltaproteobacteria bacterium]
MPRCSQPKCRIAETGICLDGHKQGCPNLLPDDLDTDSIADNVVAPTIDGVFAQQFHTGEKLYLSEASRVLNERAARVVLCAGSQRSGKTTFLARLGEMFRDGSFSHYRFAGSFTLCGFERASWLATITSGAGRPDTRRTRRAETDTFLHLRIHPEDDRDRKLDLLISDLAGETFPTAVASREFCADLRALARADHLVCFLDSARLTDPVQRHPECDNALAFLQRVRSVKHQPELLQVQVVFSRWDYITRHPERMAQEEFCDIIKTDFTTRFAESFAGLGFWRIAARPDGGLPPTNSEIQLLFSHWLETPLYHVQTPAARNRQPVRDFSAFGIV